MKAAVSSFGTFAINCAVGSSSISTETGCCIAH
jgi:hypothetical protein